jgi:hypothetical protein
VARNSFHEHIDPPDPAQLCLDLRAALAALDQVDNVRIVAMGYANPKMPEFVAVLDHAPSMTAIAAARAACSQYPHVNFVTGGIVCREHWSELSWDDLLPQPADSHHGGLLNWIRRVLRPS